MSSSDQRILTTHVGSLPRPDGLAADLTAQDRGELSADRGQTLPDRVRAGVAAIVVRQHDAGIDVVSDGELSKFGYATYVKERLTGFGGEPGPLALSELADFPRFSMRVALDVTSPSCVGPVAYRGQDAVQADIDNLEAALATSPVAGAFMNAASPGIIADYLANRHYPSDDEYLEALADAMKEEYDAIAASGLLLQLDAPDLAMGRHLAPEPLGMDEFRQRLRRRIEVINHAVRDIDPEQMRVHVCWGNYESPHHHDIPLVEIVDLLLTLRPAALLFEGANPRHAHEWQVFEDVSLPDGKRIVPGVIDTLSTYIEHPDLVAQRIVQYARLVGPENVQAGTDCGFATFANFENVDPDIAWAKLASLGEGAARASAQLSRPRATA